MPSITISLRIKPEELAKALEGLTERPIDASDLTTISSIVRNTFYYGIISLCDKPYTLAKKEFHQKINQLLNQNKRNNCIGIKNLLEKE